jgi:antitoxin ParD1/3/4
MNVSIGERWEGFVESAVRSGRYASASEVVREGLRLVEEREEKLRALRETLNASIARGGSVTDDALGASLAATSAEIPNARRRADAAARMRARRHGRILPEGVTIEDLMTHAESDGLRSR